MSNFLKRILELTDVVDIHIISVISVESALKNKVQHQILIAIIPKGTNSLHCAPVNVLLVMEGSQRVPTPSRYILQRDLFCQLLRNFESTVISKQQDA